MTPAGAGQRLTEAGYPGGGAAQPPAAPSPGIGRHRMETRPLVPMLRARIAAGLPVVGPDLWDVATAEMRP